MSFTTTSLNKQNKKIIFLASLGGALEFYDFIIYVFFAREISQLFFPQSNYTVSLMAAFSVFAIGYLIRPLGGLFFSHFGDKYGRKKTFVVTLILMAVPTLLIGLIPTYQSIGFYASILLVLLRMMQGLSVGGEIPGALTFAAEHVPQNRRGLTCALIFCGINVGLILGSSISFLLFAIFSEQEILNWAWRLPFVFGGMLGMLSYYLRKQLSETPIFEHAKQQLSPSTQTSIPALIIFKNYRMEIFQGIALVWLDAVIVSLLILYLPTYLTSVLHYPDETVHALNTLMLILHSFVFVTLGYLSDYYGRKIFLIIGSLSFIFFGYGFFYLLAQQAMLNVIIVMSAIAVLSSCITGIYTSTVIELFPTNVRYTGMAIAYNVGFALFGGFTPIIATSLISFTGNIMSPSYYLILSAAVCLVASLTLKNKHNEALL